MPGKDDRAGAPGARPAAGNAQVRGGSSVDISRGSRGGSGGAGKLLSGTERDGERGGAAAHSDDRGGRTALGKQALNGFPLDGTGGRLGALAAPPPAILRAPSSLLSRPLFLHPFPPFRAATLPPHVAAPLLFAPPLGPPEPPVHAESAAAQSQTPDVPEPTQPPADVPSPKVELSDTSPAIDAAPTADPEGPTSAVTIPPAASPSPSPDSASASTTSASAPDIVPIAFATGEPVAASQVDSSFTNRGTSDIPPVTNTGGKVAAACVIGAVFLLLLNWAFWLVIRRRRRARRSLPAHWDFAAPPPRAKGDAGRGSEEDERDAERDVKGGMVAVPV